MAKAKKQTLPAKAKKVDVEAQLLNDVASMIEQSRQYVAQTVNSTLSLLYWRIGHRINTEVLEDNRAVYGKRVIATLSQHLVEKYGSGWDSKTIRHCLRSAETFSEELIVSAAQRQLEWIKQEPESKTTGH
jgi:hypothetical protein